MKQSNDFEKSALQIGDDVATTDIQNRILTIRGKQILLDRDLAELYGVSTTLCSP